MDSTAPTPGFADPVQDSQRAFRGLLDAIARPGTVVRLDAPQTTPAPLSRAAAAVLLTLVDFETPLWLDAAAATPAVLAWTRFHCGAPIVAAPAAARFALVTDAARMPALDVFDPGQDAYPDRSATLLIEVAGLRAGDGLRLTGPGIEHDARLAVAGLPDGFVDAWGDNRALFPCGVDIFLTAGDLVAALPRTTRLEG
ncbi:alpha-D-ribose 1-methylphosphonate 5-triphosphate synthase subunit PhnH [Stella humosa]|uniref:Alpha-D-ribose 1-methylphosphonate 5-triphosphate synthase subunit PhnH n=2 Tax=Stella humosa TaxID=94 RepID=A0A3N1MF66_9PROT|nr:alpha-D-ribose 1-methylphosphonate 5-triphosphate synthase subunit PhnH [Stella humosa]